MAGISSIFLRLSPFQLKNFFRFSDGIGRRRHFESDAGTEELGHLEMVGTIVYQLTRNLTPEQIKAAGYDAYFVNHTTGIYPQNASGEPFSADTIASTGDSLADIHEDLAADSASLQEQRKEAEPAETIRQTLLLTCDDPTLCEENQRRVFHDPQTGVKLDVGELPAA